MEEKRGKKGKRKKEKERNRERRKEKKKKKKEKRRKKEKVEVSSLNKILSESRLLQQQTTDQLNFILTNRPHPLVSSGLVEHFLDAHFRRDWHFTLAQSKWFVSRNVDQHMEKAKSLPNSFA